MGKRDELATQILGAAGVARNMAVSFGVIGIMLVFLDCVFFGMACFGVFMFFGYATLSLEEQYRQALRGKVEDEES